MPLKQILSVCAFTIALYTLPIAALAGCITLGWYAQPEPAPAPTAATMLVLPGDDNADGHIDEDETGWNCAAMGNLVCGPVNA